MTAKQIREAVLRELTEKPRLLRELSVTISASGQHIRSALIQRRKAGFVKSCFFVRQTNPYWSCTQPLSGSDATPCHFCHMPCGKVEYVHSDPPDERYATCGDCLRGLGQLALTHVEGGRPVLSLEMQVAVREALSPTSPS